MTYSSFSSHRSMVFDDHRNRLYREAILAAITPESVVLDLGAGVGTLGLLAAAAGAKRVYLVEPEPIVNIAGELARANRLGDRVHILQGRIEDVSLPEQVDVILSVFTGNLLYSEDLLPALFHARDKYLKPAGILIPDGAELILAPISAPELHDKYIGCWAKSNQGLDFSPARRFAANEIWWPTRQELAGLVLLGQGQRVTGIDLKQGSSADCNGEINCPITATETCHGVLGWIRIRLGQEWLSSGPDGPEVHWTPAVFPLDPPLPVSVGDEFQLRLQRPALGDWTWTADTGSSTRRHSTFLARSDGIKRLKRLSPEHRPGLNRQGEIQFRALEAFKCGASNREAIEVLTRTQSPMEIDEARQLVQVLALRFGHRGEET